MNELKNSTTEQKIAALKLYMTDTDIYNHQLALNLHNLLRKIRMFDASFYEHESVLFSNYVEYIDIKEALADELIEFKRTMAAIYFACLRYCGDFVERQNSETIPTVYKHQLFMADFLMMSNILRELGDDLECDDVAYSDAFDIIASMSNKLNFFTQFMSKQGDQDGPTECTDQLSDTN